MQRTNWHDCSKRKKCEIFRDQFLPSLCWISLLELFSLGNFLWVSILLCNMMNIFLRNTKTLLQWRGLFFFPSLMQLNFFATMSLHAEVLQVYSLDRLWMRVPLCVFELRSLLLNWSTCTQLVKCPVLTSFLSTYLHMARKCWKCLCCCRDVVLQHGCSCSAAVTKGMVSLLHQLQRPGWWRWHLSTASTLILAVHTQNWKLPVCSCEHSLYWTACLV